MARPAIFASIIGINKYEDRNIKNLHGAVDDARAMKDYLQHNLNVPQDHINILEDKSASRDNIIQEFHRLKSDTRIQHGDCIVIFFAGHGSQAIAPEGWHSDANIQVILPSDVFCKSGGKVVQPIPDRTFGAWLEAIAREKGNNIVVIMDSCYATCGTRLSGHSSDLVRSVSSSFSLPPHLDQEILTSSPTIGGQLRSHVLLAACSSSGLAWESNGRGCFTVALIQLLEDSQIERLRYCDLVMRINIDSSQSPYCDGFNRERYMFTSTSQPSIEYYALTYIRMTKNSSNVYILNGGEAHGLAKGDEFAIYPEIGYPESDGTLVVDEVGSFYSVMRRPDEGIPVSAYSIAIRVKRRSPPLSIYSHPGSEIHEVLSVLQANDDLDIILVDDPTSARITISMQCGAAVFRIGATNLGFRIKASSEELTPILKASSEFFLELDRTAHFSEITDHIQVEIYELRRSQSPFSDSLPDVKIDPSSVRPGTSYGLKLINNSEYDLYPVVQYFDASGKFMIYTLYQPACTQSQLDVPLQKNGDFLSIGYGLNGSPLVIHGEGLGFLKVSLYTRPPQPFYQVESFRSARYLPETYKGPWATTIIRISHWRPTTERAGRNRKYSSTKHAERIDLKVFKEEALSKFFKESSKTISVLEKEDISKALQTFRQYYYLVQPSGSYAPSEPPSVPARPTK